MNYSKYALYSYKNYREIVEEIMNLKENINIEICLKDSEGKILDKKEISKKEYDKDFNKKYKSYFIRKRNLNNEKILELEKKKQLLIIEHKDSQKKLILEDLAKECNIEIDFLKELIENILERIDSYKNYFYIDINGEDCSIEIIKDILKENKIFYDQEIINLEKLVKAELNFIKLIKKYKG